MPHGFTADEMDDQATLIANGDMGKCRGGRRVYEMLRFAASEIRRSAGRPADSSEDPVTAPESEWFEFVSPEGLLEMASALDVKPFGRKEVDRAVSKLRAAAHTIRSLRHDIEELRNGRGGIGGELKPGRVLSPLELLRREHPDLRSIRLVFGGHGCPRPDDETR